jgi:hypothetical protein
VINGRKAGLKYSDAAFRVFDLAILVHNDVFFCVCPAASAAGFCPFGAVCLAVRVTCIHLPARCQNMQTLIIKDLMNCLFWRAFAFDKKVSASGPGMTAEAAINDRNRTPAGGGSVDGRKIPPDRAI